MIPYILLPRYFKYIGLALVVTGFVSASFLTVDPDNLDHSQGLWIQLSILAGTLCIAGAREKTEDEMIRQIRLKSLQWSVFIFIGIRVFHKCMAFYTHDESWLPQWQSNSLVLFYLALFYYQMYVQHWLKRLFGKERDEE